PCARRFRKEACDGREAAAVLERVGEGGRSPVLAGAEGARRAGDRVRGGPPAVPQGQARRGPASERPGRLSRDPVRGREGLPRGVEGHGRAHPRRQAVRPARRVASQAVADEAEHLRKVLLVTDAALSLLPLERLLGELLVRIRDALDADTAAFLLLDEET